MALKLLENIMYVEHAVLFDLFFIIIPAGVRAVDGFVSLAGYYIIVRPFGRMAQSPFSPQHFQDSLTLHF